MRKICFLVCILVLTLPMSSEAFIIRVIISPDGSFTNMYIPGPPTYRKQHSIIGSCYIISQCMISIVEPTYSVPVVMLNLPEVYHSHLVCTPLWVLLHLLRYSVSDNGEQFLPFAEFWFLHSWWYLNILPEKKYSSHEAFWQKLILLHWVHKVRNEWILWLQYNHQ